MEPGSVFSWVQLILYFCVCSFVVDTLFLMAIRTLKEKGIGTTWAFGFYIGTVSKLGTIRGFVEWASWDGKFSAHEWVLRTFGFAAKPHFLNLDCSPPSPKTMVSLPRVLPICHWSSRFGVYRKCEGLEPEFSWEEEKHRLCWYDASEELGHGWIRGHEIQWFISSK